MLAKPGLAEELSASRAAMAGVKEGSRLDLNADTASVVVESVEKQGTGTLKAGIAAGASVNGVEGFVVDIVVRNR